MSMSETELVAYLDQGQWCYGHAAWRQEESLEVRMRQGGDTASDAYLDLDDLSEERLESLEDRLLLVVGSVCVQAGHPELWSRIWRIWHAGELDQEDELEALREMTSRARAGERSLVDEAAWLARLRSR
jgi:hypothetical protein